MQHLAELLQFLVILVGPLPLCGSLLVVAEADDRDRRLSHCLLLVGVFWCSIQISLGLVLGMARHLTLGSVLLSEAGVFFVGLALLVFLRGRVSFSFRDLLFPRPRLTGSESLVLGAVGVVGLVVLWQLATEPITEYDSVAFHLPIMASWYQTGSLDIADSWARLGRYPYDWEVLGLLFILPFREDFLVAFPNLIAWALMGLSVYLLSVRIGAKRLPSMTAAALVLTMPMVVEHVNSIHVDLPFATFFMVSLYLGVVALDRARVWSGLPSFLMAFGLFLGIKTSSFPYAVLLVVALGILWAIPGLRDGRRSATLPVVLARYTRALFLVGVLCFLLLGGYWYGSNFVRDGNPLGGYIGLRIGGFTILPARWDLGVGGDLLSSTLAGLFRLTSPKDWGILLEQLWIHWQMPFIGLVLLAMPLVPALMAGRGEFRKSHLLMLVSLVVATAALYWGTPFSADGSPRAGEITPWIGQALRYAFPFIGVLAVTAAAGATSIRAPAALLAAIVVMSSVLAMRQSDMGVAGMILLSGWGLFVVAGRPRPAVKVPRAMKLGGRFVLVLILLGVLGFASFEAREQRDVRRHVLYAGIPEYVAANLGPGEGIAAVLTHRCYLLFGRDLATRVLCVLGPSESLAEWVAALQTGDLPKWLDLLRGDGLSVVAIGPLSEELNSMPEVKRIVGWLNDPGGPFTRVFDNSEGNVPTLYRLKDSQNVGRAP